ncbi:MAG: insulinase family protein [Alistipes senegalensis]|nr:insulinase family protein [Oxalobacter formigenes]MCM1280216.1 insulinase family protein [Alistipes senegalensis]
MFALGCGFFSRLAGSLGVILLLLVQVPLQAAPVESWVTKNGVKVFFVENHVVPILDISVDFDAGSRRDPEGKAGLASLTNLMLAGGIAAARYPLHEPAMTEAQVSDALADTGAQQAGSVGPDRANMTLRTLSSQRELDRAVRLLARMLAQPAFPAVLLQRDRTRAVAAVREMLTQPNAIASRAFMSALYGRHPYAFNPTPDSLQAITKKDVVAFFRQHYVAESAVIAMVGDVSRSRAEAIAEELSMRLNRRKKGEVLPALPEVPPAEAREVFIAHPATQSHILIGMPAIRRGDPDFFALMLGNHVLGSGGFVSRLMQEVREQRGLSYSVSSQLDPRLQKGPFLMGLQTKKDQTRQAVGVVMETFRHFMQQGPTAEELAAAKDNLVKGFPLRMDDNKKILALLSLIGYYGLPLDYLDTWTAQVEAVTAEAVCAAFQKKLSANSLTTVIVGGSE